MGIKSLVLLLLVSTVTNAWPHHHHHHHHHHHRHGFYPEHKRENSNVDFVEQRSNLESERTTDADVRTESSKKNEKYAEVLNSKRSIPFSARRLEKMLEKAILQIIIGDLRTGDMQLLKSLNYTPEEIQAIREREFGRRKHEKSKKMTESNGRVYYGENLHENKATRNSMDFDPDVSRNEKNRNRYREKESFDYDSYNRQAVIDYENTASEIWSEPANFDYEDESGKTERQEPSQSLHRSFDRAMEPHVIFKIPYDNSEFDSSSGSDESSKSISRDALVSLKGLQHRAPSTLRHKSAKNVANSFHASSLSTSSSSSSSPPSSSSSPASFAELTPLPIVYQRGNFKDIGSDRPENQSTFSTTESPLESIIAEAIINNVTSNETSNRMTNLTNSGKDDNTNGRKIGDYEGLEWVEDDIYRVKPDFVDRLNNVDENDMSDSQEQSQNFFTDGNDTVEYQNEATDSARLVMANVNTSVENASQADSPAYQKLMIARADQTAKVIREIQEKILHITGRGTNTSQVHQERLTTFWPTCQLPRNTDSEAWMDPFSMNMHFQLNLTSDSYVVAARLRLYVLPQENIAPPASEDFDEEKIRISAYYYTKSLKKHRSKKRLMDSVVTPLTTAGTHLALDVRQGVVNSNHGLVIQVEDQDGRPLKPALYLQQTPCGNNELDRDEKAFQLIPALFFRACTRYVRIDDYKEVTYLNCKNNTRYENSINHESTEFVPK